jgi:hypothetical protein
MRTFKFISIILIAVIFFSCKKEEITNSGKETSADVLLEKLKGYGFKEEEIQDLHAESMGHIFFIYN